MEVLPVRDKESGLALGLRSEGRAPGLGKAGLGSAELCVGGGECAGQQESREAGVLNVASRLPELLETPIGAGHVAGW